MTVGMPRDLYQQISNLGWNGLIVPEKFGGAGLGMLDMSVLLEECGYAALARTVPIFVRACGFGACWRRV
jgi:alkylation response protein AidB-like acyl-CoA dehydrogenase